MPWSEAEFYRKFLKEYGVRPDELRKWAASDIWMVQCAEIIEYINKTNEPKSKAELEQEEALIREGMKG